MVPRAKTVSSALTWDSSKIFTSKFWLQFPLTFSKRPSLLFRYNFVTALKHCAASWKVTVSIPDEVIEFSFQFA
jgi:hypothetical protein